jgi:hypothetical protein
MPPDVFTDVRRGGDSEVDFIVVGPLRESKPSVSDSDRVTTFEVPCVSSGFWLRAATLGGAA